MLFQGANRVMLKKIAIHQVGKNFCPRCCVSEQEIMQALQLGFVFRAWFKMQNSFRADKVVLMTGRGNYHPDTSSSDHEYILPKACECIRHPEKINFRVNKVVNLWIVHDITSDLVEQDLSLLMEVVFHKW